jgi:hypothetical protein
MGLFFNVEPSSNKRVEYILKIVKSGQNPD